MVNRYKTEWQRGDKTRLAKSAGITRAYLWMLLRRKYPCRPVLAAKLEEAAQAMGYRIPKAAWCFGDPKNPLLG